MLKALAFHSRGAEKDAYDLYYVWQGLGIEDVVECLRLLRGPELVEVALGYLERDFGSFDSPGPARAARFIDQEGDENKQADISGLARRMLFELG